MNVSESAETGFLWSRTPLPISVIASIPKLKKLSIDSPVHMGSNPATNAPKNAKKLKTSRVFCLLRMNEKTSTNASTDHAAAELASSCKASGTANASEKNAAERNAGRSLKPPSRLRASPIPSASVTAETSNANPAE